MSISKLLPGSSLDFLHCWGYSYSLFKTTLKTLFNLRFPSPNEVQRMRYLGGLVIIYGMITFWALS